MAERILIVDDDPVQRRLLEDMATRFGYEVDDRRGRRAAVAAPDRHRTQRASTAWCSTW